MIARPLSARRPAASKGRWAALVLAVLALLAACGARVPRLTAPLSYAPAAPLADEAFRASPPALPPLDTTPLFGVLRSRLANGVEILLVPRRGLPLFTARLVALRGARDLPAGQQREELLDLAAAAVLHEHESSPRANPQLRPDVGCSSDRCQAAVSGVIRSFDGALDVLADLAIRPRFPESQLGQVRRQFRSFAERLGGTSDSAVDANVRSLLFPPEDPYSTIDPDERVVLQRVTMKMLEDAYVQVFQPQHAVLVVAGDLDMDRLKAAAERALGAWSQSRPPLTWTAWSPVFPGAPGRTILVDATGELVHAHLVVRGPTRGDPTWEAMMILAILLSTPKGSLFEELRSGMGATYDIEADFSAFRVASYWEIGGAFELDKAPQAVTALLSAVRRARDGGVSAADLDGARTRFVASYRSTSATTTGVTSMIAGALSVGLPLEHWLTQPGRASRLTAEDVQKAAQKWLAEPNLRLVVVGPRRWIEGRFDSQEMGTVEWRTRIGERLR